MCKGEKPTLFTRLGGVAAVKAAVDEFYTRILDDPKLAGFFEGIPMAFLKVHQVKFMKLAFTEVPQDVDVVALLTDKHKRLFEKGLNGEHFDLVAGHFVGALQHLGVEQALIDEAVGVVGPLRPIFVAGAEKYGASETKTQEPTEQKVSLMDKLGGISALKAAVEEFYTRILADPDLSFFFKDVTMTALKMHQLAFMKIAFTQIPEDLDVPKLMKEKHAPLFAKGLTAVHFDKVAGHFVATLDNLNVPSDLVNEAVSVIAPLRVVFE